MKKRNGSWNVAPYNVNTPEHAYASRSVHRLGLIVGHCTAAAAATSPTGIAPIPPGGCGGDRTALLHTLIGISPALTQEIKNTRGR